MVAMEKTNEQLIFIYNAKSGFMHGVIDLMHKTASPKTYPCKLCQITFSGATMNKFWKGYVAGLGIPALFMHRDEFAKIYPSVTIKFPAILLKKDRKLSTLLGADEFKSIEDLPGLMKTLDDKLKHVR